MLRLTHNTLVCNQANGLQIIPENVQSYVRIIAARLCPVFTIAQAVHNSET